MSMIGNFAAIPLEQFDELCGDPAAIDEYLCPESGDYPDDVHPECDFLCVNKAWHAMHFALTGSSWEGSPPLSLAVLGGEEFGEDMGYGPPRFLNPSEVSEVSRALGAISPADMIAKIQPADLDNAEIYPTGWANRAKDEGLEWIAESLTDLTSFYTDAASNGKVVIKYLT